MIKSIKHELTREKLSPFNSISFADELEINFSLFDEQLIESAEEQRAIRQLNAFNLITNVKCED